MNKHESATYWKGYSGNGWHTVLQSETNTKVQQSLLNQTKTNHFGFFLFISINHVTVFLLSSVILFWYLLFPHFSISYIFSLLNKFTFKMLWPNPQYFIVFSRP